MVTDGGSRGNNKILLITPRDGTVIPSKELEDHASPTVKGMNQAGQRLKAGSQRNDTLSGKQRAAPIL